MFDFQVHGVMLWGKSVNHHVLFIPSIYNINSMIYFEKVKKFCDTFYSLIEDVFLSPDWSVIKLYSFMLITACPLNTYMDDWSTGGVCLDCPENSRTTTVGSTNRQQCICDDGYSGPNGGPCQGKLHN